VWEATKWFELQSDVAIVGGRILDDRDFVVDAGSRVTAGETIALYRGVPRTDAGAFALALKAQTIDAPAEGFFVVERRFLETAIESVIGEGFTKRRGATLGALAKAQQRRVSTRRSSKHGGSATHTTRTAARPSCQHFV
jgi:hypothetical protein